MNRFPNIPIGTPISFKAQGVGGPEEIIDGFVEDILIDWAISAQGIDGRYHLVMDTDFVCEHVVN